MRLIPDESGILYPENYLSAPALETTHDEKLERMRLNKQITEDMNQAKVDRLVKLAENPVLHRAYRRAITFEDQRSSLVNRRYSNDN